MDHEFQELFSKDELDVLQNKAFFYLKRSATGKIMELFNELAESIQQLPEHQSFKFPPGTDCQSAKISKGENYLQLPYIVLDFPRLFSRDSIFAYRVMFWWGNELSFTLLICGKAFQHFADILILRYEQIQNNLETVYVCVDETPWRHEFEPDNYIAAKKVSAIDFAGLIKKNGFCKLSVRTTNLDRKDWMEKGLRTYRFFLETLYL